MSINPKQFSILLKDNNGKFVSYLENKVNISNLSWDWTRIGGCGACDLVIRENWDAAIVSSFTEDYEVNIYASPTLNGTAELFYSGFIDRVTPQLTNNEESVQISCLGYVNQLKKVVVRNKEYTGCELSAIANDVINTYVSPITKILNSELDDIYTKLLIHFDGENGSTAFTDVYNHAITVTGDGATISTVIQKFGTGALWASSANAQLNIGTNSDFNFGANDFTIDFQIMFTASTDSIIISQDDGALGVWKIYHDVASFNKLNMLFCRPSDGAVVGRYSTDNQWNPTIGRWYHLEFARYGTGARIFIDGISQALTTVIAFGTNDVGIMTNPLTVNPTSLGFIGYMDELRICKGIARHTTDFNPPQTAYISMYDLTDFSADKLYFDENAYDVISKLSELAGNREWGVDANKVFFFKKRSNTITRWLNLTEKALIFNPERDFNPVITKIYLLGGEGYEAQFSITNKKSIKEEIVSNGSIVTQSVGQQFARMYLKEKGIPSRSYSLDLVGYNQRLESTIPLGKVSIFERIGLQSKYDTTAKYDTGVKYDGGTENYQIERIKYSVSEDGINIGLILGQALPSIVNDLAKLEYLINSERSR